MMQIHTYSIKTHPASSMRAALNSKYCMRAQILARSQVNGQSSKQENNDFFSYQDGQHRVGSNEYKLRTDGNDKFYLPEEVKIKKTKNGKLWSTSTMTVELAGDIIEVRDGLGKVVDALVLKHPTDY